MKQKLSIFWHRRDLRLNDNAGLYRALNDDYPVLPLFIFDTTILDALQDRDDARVSFIHDAVAKLQAECAKRDKAFLVEIGKPMEVWRKLYEHFDIQTVFANRDYEPYAQKRDSAVYEFLQQREVAFVGCKDHVIFEKRDILTAQNAPYTVFTPYARNWQHRLRAEDYQLHPSETHLDHLAAAGGILADVADGIEQQMPSLEAIGFTRSAITVPDFSLDDDILNDYKTNRDLPALEGTSRLSPHLRFGTVSVREVVAQVKDIAPSFLNEIIWRDFYAQVLYNHPHVVDGNFRAKYNGIKWKNDPQQFEKWCEGKTGFPIVDAGMRQLNQTGWMHNRVRMITASFLCKDLLIDWRWGEAYFARKLLDFDLASNNGGWQWAAGTGTDAAPYFRIFNPESQLKKHDPTLEYVKKWVPEYGTKDYPAEMVDHKAVRERTLRVYKEALGGAEK